MNFILNFFLAIICIHSSFSNKLKSQKRFCDDDSVLLNPVLLEPNGRDSSINLPMLHNGNSYPAGFECSVRINASAGQFLLVNFDLIDTRPCGQDAIQIHTESSSTVLCGRYHCPAANCPKYSFENIPEITIHFNGTSSNKDVQAVGFLTTITAYSIASTDGCREKNRFQCDNKRCIWDGLHCDGYNNCGDNSDEPPGCAKSVWGVLVIVLGVLSMCFFLPLFCYLAVWGPRRRVPVRIMGNTSFGPQVATSVNDEEAVPFLSVQPVQGSMPGETFTFYYGAISNSNPRC